MGNMLTSYWEWFLQSEERNRQIRNTEAQLQKMRIEISKLQPLITEKVTEQICTLEDSTVIRYSDLKDISEMSKHIETIVKDEQALEFLKSAATKMVAAFKSSKQMTHLYRWNQVKKVLKCGDKVVGMELHYKVIITEEKFGMFPRIGGLKRINELWEDDIVVILAYKFIQQALDVNPAQLPEDEAVKALRFLAIPRIFVE